MKKQLGYYAFGLCSLALVAFAILQNSHIHKQEDQKKVLVSKIERQERTIDNLEDIIERYREENAMLVDSILELNSEVRGLNLEIDEQSKIVKLLENKLNKKLREFRALEKKISELEAREQDYSVEIARLEAEKTQLLKDYSDAEVNVEIAKERKVDLERIEIENRDLIEEKRKRLVIDDIVNNTIINFQEVKIGSKPKAADIRKVKKGNKKWMYSSFEFIMAHGKNSEAIRNEQFTLKIIDKDTGKILPYLEENPSYPESEAGTAGTVFRFTNNPINVLHVNTQVKMGKNYETRIYFVKNGEEYLLANSHRLIINNGKAVN